VYLINRLSPYDFYDNRVGLTLFNSSLNCECAEIRFITDPTKTIRYCKNRAFDIFIRNLRDDGFVSE